MGREQLKKRLSYEQYVKKGLEFDRKQREYKQQYDHRMSLVNVANNYGTSPSTGQVYDTRILERNLRLLEAEIYQLNEELEYSK